jgi:iron complex transport system substrate-binding protein
MTSLEPQRIVCLQPSATATLAALGVAERIVACTRYCIELCPEVAGRAVVQDSWTVQADEIRRLRADLVLASVPYQEKAIAEILKSGARVVLLAPLTLEDVYGDIALIAAVVGVPGRGEEVIAAMQREIAEVARRASGLARPRVYCEEWGRPLIASQPWIAELVAAAGGEFVGEAGKPTTQEAVRAAAPEIIVAAWCGAGDRVPLEKIIAARGWEDLPAMRAGRVYCINDELLNTPAPTLLGGLRALARAIHPERFPAAAGVRRISSAVVEQ